MRIPLGPRFRKGKRGVNVRMTMGRVALELMRKSRPGCQARLRILRKAHLAPGQIADLHKGTLQQGSVLLNDPGQAREFLVHWEVGGPAA